MSTEGLIYDAMQRALAPHFEGRSYSLRVAERQKIPCYQVTVTWREGRAPLGISWPIPSFDLVRSADFSAVLEEHAAWVATLVWRELHAEG